MGRHSDFDDDETVLLVEERGGGVSNFFWGLAIGAGVALLLAPKSGVDTRRDLRRRAGKVKVAAKDAASGLTDTVVDGYQQARRSVEDRIDMARRALEIKREQASQAIRAGREAAQQARDDLEARIAESKAAYQAGGAAVREARRGSAKGPRPVDPNGSTGA